MKRILVVDGDTGVRARIVTLRGVGYRFEKE